MKPFSVRLAICFTGNGKPAQPKTDFKKMFQVTRGYKAYGSPTSNGKTLEARQLWFDIPECNNLDAQNAGNLTGCPAKGKAFKVNGKETCPDGQTPTNGVCPTKPLTAADSYASWAANEDSWYYDAADGYLYLHLVQKVDNGLGAVVAVADRQLRPGQGVAVAARVSEREEGGALVAVPGELLLLPADRMHRLRRETGPQRSCRRLRADPVCLSASRAHGTAPCHSPGRCQDGNNGPEA